MAHVRPLLRNALRLFKERPTDNGARSFATFETSLDMTVTAGHVGSLPVVLQLKPVKPRRGETWVEYRARVGAALDRKNQVLTGGSGMQLHAACAIAAHLPLAQVEKLADTDIVQSLELDRIVQATTMDDVGDDIGVAAFRATTGVLTGKGVRVAVLDSGVDTRHPMLRVLQSVETCGEPVEIPGRHGTHVAGSIASQDAVFPGIAPGCELLNIKVLRHDGSGTSTSITKGVDAALDLDAHILSMSLGFNHLPVWSNAGHGWSCPEGRCELCTAVDNAVFFGRIVCVAAGNEHDRADALRANGQGGEFDTELGCPGQSRGAITVGAITKRTFLPAFFSSRGPSSYGLQKPDLVAAGINITSTIPAPRMPNGDLLPDPPRHQLFGRSSGTSMATPIVAGAIALLVEHRRSQGLSVQPRAVRKELLTNGVTSIGLGPNVVGAGRLDLSHYGGVAPTS